ncbi:MAG: hypothetical protein R3F60_06365 [bacterium]
MGGVLAFLALGGAIGVIALLVKTFQRYEQAWSDAVLATARALDIQYQPKTFWKRALASGTRDGVDLTVDCYTVSTGKSSTTYTRIVALAGIPSDLVLKAEGLGASIVKVFKGDDLEVGDPHFDARAVVRGSPRLLRALLDRPTRDLVLQALDLGIVVEDGKVKFNKAGLIRDADRLVHLAQVVADLAQALRPRDARGRLEHIALHDPMPQVAIEAFRERMAGWPAGDFVQTALRHPLPVIRLEAARALGPAGVAVVEALLDDRDVPDDLQLEALELLLRLDPDQGVRRAEARLQGQAPPERVAATLALLADAGRCPTIDRVKHVLRRNARISMLAARCLAHADPHPEVEPALMLLLLEG